MLAAAGVSVTHSEQIATDDQNHWKWQSRGKMRDFDGSWRELPPTSATSTPRRARATRTATRARPDHPRRPRARAARRLAVARRPLRRARIDDRRPQRPRLLPAGDGQPRAGRHLLRQPRPPGDLDGFARLRAAHPIYVVDRPGVRADSAGDLEFATDLRPAVSAEGGARRRRRRGGRRGRDRGRRARADLHAPRPRSCRPRTTPAI
jgi:hypothetical protein